MRAIVVCCLIAGSAGFVRPGRGADIQVESVVLNLVADVEVPATEAGSLVEVAVTEGRRVEAGELLARVDDRDALLDVVRAEIALEHAKQQAANDIKLRIAQQALKLAELELKKAEDANRELERVVSVTQIEKLRIELERARLEVEQASQELAVAARAVTAADNELRVAQRAIERRRIVAPIDGVVVDVRRRLGEWLDPGKPVVRLVRDDRLRAEGFVHVDKLQPLLVGKSAELIAQLPGQKPATFSGTVTFVSPEVNPVNRQVRVWAEFDNSDGRLRPGLSVTLKLKTGSQETQR